MDYTVLRALIAADFDLAAKAQAGETGAVADALNTPSIPTKIDYQLTTLRVLNVLGASRGTVVMAALRSPAMAEQFGEIVKLMDQVAAGVNLNHPDADAMFAGLVTADVLTQAESDQILALRDSTISPAVQAFGRPVTHLEVAAAMRSS